MKNSSKKLLTSADWDIDIQACSATDCTGLIPRTRQLMIPTIINPKPTRKKHLKLC